MIVFTLFISSSIIKAPFFDKKILGTFLYKYFICIGINKIKFDTPYIAKIFEFVRHLQSSVLVCRNNIMLLLWDTHNYHSVDPQVNNNNYINFQNMLNFYGIWNLLYIQHSAVQYLYIFLIICYNSGFEIENHDALPVPRQAWSFCLRSERHTQSYVLYYVW